MLTTNTISPLRICSAACVCRLGESATVAKGDKLVGALGPDSAKGYVKAVPELSLPSDLEAIAATATQAEHNALRTAINSLKTEVETLSGLKGKGSVVDFDSIPMRLSHSRVNRITDSRILNSIRKQ